MMGVFIGGIILFLSFSIILFFSKGDNKANTKITGGPTPTLQHASSPYPTIPPIKDMTVLINERRLNPPTVTIQSGNSIEFLNIGASSAVIEGEGQNSSFLNFTIEVNDMRPVVFSTAGTYIYKVRGTDLRGTITIK